MRMMLYSKVARHGVHGTLASASLAEPGSKAIWLPLRHPGETAVRGRPTQLLGARTRLQAPCTLLPCLGRTSPSPYSLSSLAVEMERASGLSRTGPPTYVEPSSTVVMRSPESTVPVALESPVAYSSYLLSNSEPVSKPPAAPSVGITDSCEDGETFDQRTQAEPDLVSPMDFGPTKQGHTIMSLLSVNGKPWPDFHAVMPPMPRPPSHPQAVEGAANRSPFPLAPTASFQPPPSSQALARRNPRFFNPIFPTRIVPVRRSVSAPPGLPKPFPTIGPPINHESPQLVPYPSSTALQSNGSIYNASFMTSPSDTSSPCSSLIARSRTRHSKDSL